MKRSLVVPFAAVLALSGLGALEAGGLLPGLRSRWLEQGDWVAQLP